MAYYTGMLATDDAVLGAFFQLATLELVTETGCTATDTLALNEIAGRSVVLQQISEDTLSLDEGVSNYRAIAVKKHDSLVLSDGAIGEYVKLVSDVLSLEEYVVVDRITHCFDTLALGDEAVFNGIYGRDVIDTLSIGETTQVTKEIGRDASDSLSLGESNVGDHCRVIEEILIVSDVADSVHVRPAYDILSLDEETDRSGSIYNRDIHDWLNFTLTDVADGWREFMLSATDVLSLSDGATIIVWANDTLSIGDVASADYSQVASDVLGLGDEASVTRDRYSGYDELIDMSDSATVNFIRYRHSHDQLSLKEKARPGFHRLSATDELQRIFISYDPITFEEIVTYDGLQDLAIVSISHAAPKVAEDHLSFAENALGIRIAYDAIPESATDSLSLSDGAFLCENGASDDTISLSDSADVVASKLLIDDLVLFDTASYNVNRNSLSASDAIVLGEAVLWYNRLEDFLYVYHPFVGESSVSNPDPPPEELEGPIPGVTEPFMLTYPVVGPFSDTLVLRAPNLGNRDRFQMNRISRETRGGTLVVFADSMWPKIQTLVLDFSGLTWAEVSGLNTFMDDHLGQEIGMIDWEHRFWSGVITKLDDPIVQDGRGCKYSVGFEFEGELAEYLP